MREYAAKLLSGRGANGVGVQGQAAAARAADLDDIDGIVAQLKEYGALNDRKYAEHFAETRAGSGNFGRQRVVSDLLRKKRRQNWQKKQLLTRFRAQTRAKWCNSGWRANIEAKTWARCCASREAGVCIPAAAAGRVCERSINPGAEALRGRGRATGWDGRRELDQGRLVGQDADSGRGDGADVAGGEGCLLGDDDAARR